MLLPSVYPLEKLQNLSRVKLTFFHHLLNSRVINVSECIKLLFFTNCLLSFVQIMTQLSLGESSKSLSPQKARLLEELEDT